MLKIRVIPILTFNGFALVKTKQFGNPRMVGNPVQAARVYNARGVDELAFIDIFATKQNRKINLPLVKDIIKECFMPVSIGGGIENLEDINNLLKIGADKIILKSIAITNPNFVKEAAHFFGNQCVSIAVDAELINSIYWIKNEQSEKIKLNDFIIQMQDLGAGELLVNAVNNDGMMNGFDCNLMNEVLNNSSIPVIAIGGGGVPSHFKTLFEQTKVEAVGCASIFHFTQYTPLDIKNALNEIGKPVRLNL